MGRPLARTRE